MSAIDEAIQKHFETCAEELPKKYVPWSWVVMICIGIVASIGGASWAMSSQLQDMKSSLRYQEKRIEQLETMAIDIKWMRDNWGKR